MNKKIVISLGISFLMSTAGFSLPAKHRTVGPALKELGYNYAAWKYRVGKDKTSIGYQVTEVDTRYKKDYRRYGYDCSKGLFGDPNPIKKCPEFVRPAITEEVSVSIITQVIRSNHNPLGLINNKNYVVTNRDIKDIVMSFDPGPRGKGFAYFTLFLREYSMLPFEPNSRSTGDLEYEISPGKFEKPQ